MTINKAQLKMLAEAAGSVEWKWWDSNSTVRLTTEVNGRHGPDGDAISAYRDSVQCPEVFRAFIEDASPSAVLDLIDENERLFKLLERMVDQYVPLTELEGVPGWSRVVELVEVVAQRDQLKAFAVEMINASFEGGSFDGGDIQDIAVKHGLLQIEQREEECGEGCACREHGFPAECYRKTSLLTPEVGHD